MPVAEDVAAEDAVVEDEAVKEIVSERTTEEAIAEVTPLLVAGEEVVLGLVHLFAVDLTETVTSVEGVLDTDDSASTLLRVDEGSTFVIELAVVGISRTELDGFEVKPDKALDVGVASVAELEAILTGVGVSVEDA